MAADPIQNLISLLARLPGVGERTATRLAFHILEGDPEYASQLGSSLSTVHSMVQRCHVCSNYGSQELCWVCSDPRRDASTICVVARVPDLVAIEKSSMFRGRYHVLHSLLAPLDGVGPDQLPLDKLLARAAEPEVTEIILATPLSVEGEATALYVTEALREVEVRVSRIAAGIPHGGELEYTDQVTLGRALEERRAL